MNLKTTLSLFSASGILILFTGCAFGVTNVRVAHSPLDPVAPKRDGAILVKPFADSRIEDKQYIGTKRNGFGMPLGNIGVRDGINVDALLTQFFVEALQHAGYEAVLASNEDTFKNKRFHAVLEGEIRKFWLDLYMATWHDVNIHLTLSDENGQVLWTRDIEGGESNVLWLGVKSEFEKVIRQALDQALNRAAQEFTSEEFYHQVNAVDSAKALPE